MRDGCEMAQGYYFSKPLPGEAAKGPVMEDASW
jgi:EAL domain-containing protein (putative c-di-GMP-specific phosphodiesterase class I)